MACTGSIAWILPIKCYNMLMPVHFQIIMAFDKQHYNIIIKINTQIYIKVTIVSKRLKLAFITKLGQETPPMGTKYIHEDKLPEQHKRHLLALIPYIYG